MNTSKHMEFRKKFVHSSFHGGWNRAESAVKDLWINLSVRLVLGIPTARSIPDIFHTQTTQKHVTFGTLCRTTLEKSLLDELGRPRRVAVDSAEDDQYEEVR